MISHPETDPNQAAEHDPTLLMQIVKEYRRPIEQLKLLMARSDLDVNKGDSEGTVIRFTNFFISPLILVFSEV